MREFIKYFICAVLFAIPGFCQDKPISATADLTIKSYTKLVQIPAVVTDKSGKPVHGLTKEDFVLYEDGKPVKISTFQSSTQQREAVQSGSDATPGEFRNVAPGKPVERPILILVIDAISTPFMDQAQSRRQMIKFLSEKVEPGTLLSLMVIGRSGFHMIHEYTVDPKILVAALRRVTLETNSSPVDLQSATGNESFTPGEVALVARETQLFNSFISGGDGEFEGLIRSVSSTMALATLRMIAQRFAGVPGRKALIWTASNFPHYSVDDNTSVSSSDYGGRFLQTFEQLTNANIAVYPIDAGGLIGRYAPVLTTDSARNPGGASTVMGSSQVLGGRGDTDMGRINSAPNPVDNMKTVAELTGGVPYYGTNDLAGAMKKAVIDSSGYYMLGYYLTGGADAKPGRRKIKVVVTKPGFNIRSRTRVYVTPQSLSPKAEMAAALRSPLEFTNIPIIVRFDPVKARSNSENFEVRLSGRDLELAEPDRTISVSYVVEARSARGKILDRIDQTLSGKVNQVDEFRNQPFVYNNKLGALGEAATVRFIVRDNHSGKIGSVIVEMSPAPVKTP